MTQETKAGNRRGLHKVKGHTLGVSLGRQTHLTRIRNKD